MATKYSLLKSLTAEQLREIAKQHDISGLSGLKKADLAKMVAEQLPLSMDEISDLVERFTADKLLGKIRDAREHFLTGRVEIVEPFSPEMILAKVAGYTVSIENLGTPDFVYRCDEKCADWLYQVSKGRSPFCKHYAAVIAQLVYEGLVESSPSAINHFSELLLSELYELVETRKREEGAISRPTDRGVEKTLACLKDDFLCISCQNSGMARAKYRSTPDRSTAKHYTSDLRLFVQHHPGPLSEITPQDVDVFVDQQRAQGLAPSTVKRRVAALKTFFDVLAETLEDPNRPNPVSMRRHAGRQPKLLPRDLSDAEVERFMAVIEEPRDSAMVALMLYAGLRVGEVAVLRPADITVPEEPEAPIRLRVMGKGRKERVAYLCREGYQPLAQYLQEHPPPDLETPLFRNRFGKPITVGGIQERIAHSARLSGVQVTCHQLRHTYGRWMAESEMPVLALARLLGHSNLQITQRYIDGADP